jgi:glyoxylase-like metal-dependent hydrolase (beta-lactamase superfamily II)
MLARPERNPYSCGMSEAPEQTPEIVVGRTVFQDFGENCWLIGHTRTKEAICIDPGGDAEQVLDLARQMGLTIKVIAPSHGHIDHIAGVGSLRQRIEAPVLIHPGDIEMLRYAKDMGARWGMQVDDPGEPDGLLAEGDDIEVDGLKLRVLHTPGHTQGSICFYVDGVVFAGDTLFAGSIGRTDLPGGDYEQEMASICDRLLALPDDTLVLPGHMDQTTIGHERQRNPYVRMELERRAGEE